MRIKLDLHIKLNNILRAFRICYKKKTVFISIFDSIVFELNQKKRNPQKTHRERIWAIWNILW